MKKGLQRLPDNQLIEGRLQTSCSKSKHEDGKCDSLTDRIQYKQSLRLYQAGQKRARAKDLNKRINELRVTGRAFSEAWHKRCSGKCQANSGKLNGFDLTTLKQKGEGDYVVDNFSGVVSALVTGFHRWSRWWFDSLAARGGAGGSGHQPADGSPDGLKVFAIYTTNTDLLSIMK
jgi:hypothetical protein